MYNLLHGLRVVDVTTVVLGPYATQILGDFGADVIKIESIAGDLWRAVRPGRSATMGAGFINSNRNKRSVALDLKTEEGRAIVRRMVEGADVFVHNMRPKAAERLGLSYDALKALNPGLLYCSAAGFGEDGPYADWPAYDDIIQSMTGLTYMTSSANGEPRFFTTVICDKVGALHLAIALLAGVAHRLKTGEGLAIEAPMFESLASFMMVEQLAGVSFEPPIAPMGYMRLLSPERRPYPTKDGFITALPYTTPNWTQFMELIGRPELMVEDWVNNHSRRSENIDRLYRLIAEATPRRTTDEWLGLLRARDIPCAPVLHMDELPADPHLVEVGFFEEYDHPTEGPMRQARSPFVVKGAPREPDRPAPGVGADTKAVLEEFGYGDDAIGELIARGIARADA